MLSPVWSAGCAAGEEAYSAALLLRLSKHSVVAEKDPRLEESLAFENA